MSGKHSGKLQNKGAWCSCCKPLPPLHSYERYCTRWWLCPVHQPKDVGDWIRPAGSLPVSAAKINDTASAGGERERAAQRCDPTDEMRGSPDLPDALLEFETEMGDGERGRDSGGPVSLYQIPPWHMVTEVRGRKAWGQSVKLSENTVLL